MRQQNSSAKGQFGLMGADFLLDRDGKLWIIEINLFMPVKNNFEDSKAANSERFLMYQTSGPLR